MSVRKPSVDVVTHVPFEGPAAIAERASVAGMSVRIHPLWDGAALPDVAEIERLVVMGGPMGALDDAAHPYLAEERVLLADLVTHDIPVLGVCLGAQLLAAALGARVYEGPAPEIGAGSVRLLDPARRDPVLGVVQVDELPVFHWHGDTFDLPAGATLLASSDAYPSQAFRLANAWGFQFHIELRPSDGDTVRANLDDGFTVTDHELAAIESVGTAIIDAFLST